VEVVYGVTSLSPERATPGRLLALVRGQWQIEHQSHWGRAVTCAEDRSQVRCGNMPQVMAALRHTVIGLLRYAGYANIAAACRRLAAQPLQALALVGIALENSMTLANLRHDPLTKPLPRYPKLLKLAARRWKHQKAASVPITYAGT
jgi:hypothetical protein